MPEKDGYELIHEIKSKPGQINQSTVTIALTAYASETDKNRILQAGFQAFLPKPFESSMLIKLITELKKIKDSA